jgi:sugar lactone lactonase YvrE
MTYYKGEALMMSRWKALLSIPLFLYPLVAAADNVPQIPQDVSFKTLVSTDRAIEGLTGDSSGNLYTGGSGAAPCPIYRINLANPSLPLPVVGNVPAAVTPAGSCGFSGITFNAVGDLFVADGGAGRVYRFTPNATTPPDATVFVSGVPGTNGLAFDRDGNLWTGDGTTGQGRVWRISSTGGVCEGGVTGCEEVFRVQPMRNGTDLGGQISAPGVGRQNNSVPTNNAQNLVANGIAFNRQGDMFVADTARGAIWKVQLDRQGNVKSEMGCDPTFTANTLCLSNVFVAHPILEGADGIALDVAGNIWVDANERNAVAVVTSQGSVVEVFRNPVNGSGLRNSAADNSTILEFPTSPFLLGKTFCTSNSDGDRRDNSPRSAGEINAANGQGKISCMNEDLKIPGLPLPLAGQPSKGRGH